MNKEAIIQELEKKKAQTSSPTAKAALEQKINVLKNSKTVEK